MNIKILCHIMPWEIDYVGSVFTNIKKAQLTFRFIDKMKNIKFHVDSVLNLSSHIIDWDKSKLPKGPLPTDFFQTGIFDPAVQAKLRARK